MLVRVGEDARVSKGETAGLGHDPRRLQLFGKAGGASPSYGPGIRTEAHERGRMSLDVPAEDGPTQIGRWMPQREDRRFLTGQGRYVDDIAFPGALHARFVRSPHARARIDAIEAAAARAMPGVAAVVMGRDLAGWTTPLRMAPPIEGLQTMVMEAFPTAKVRFDGDLVACVVAAAASQAEDAAEQVLVEYDALPAVVDAATALRPGATRVDDALDGNLVSHQSFTAGDPARRFANAHRIIEARFHQHRQTHAPMETRGCCAVWDAGRKHLTMHAGNQAPHPLRTQLALRLGLSESQVAVVCPDTGGAFGRKIALLREELAVAALAGRRDGRHRRGDGRGQRRADAVQRGGRAPAADAGRHLRAADPPLRPRARRGLYHRRRGKGGESMQGGDERVLIWGAGAIGGTVGATLKRAGHDVTFVDVVPEHVAAIRGPGLHVRGPVEDFTVQAPALLPAEVSGAWPRVFLCVKAHHTAAACQALLPHLARDGCVLSLQNGLNETVIAGIAGPGRTVGAFVNFGADWMGPGEVLFGNRGAVVLGEIDGAMTPRLQALHALLQVFEPDAVTTPDIWSYLWGKLGYGAMLFAQALGSMGIADCLARPELLPAWRALGGEAVAVAEGVQPRGFNGFDPDAFRPGATQAQAQASVDAMVAFNRPSAKTHSGIWRDIAVRRRQTEVDAQIAPIIAAGARHGLACPTTAKLVALIHEAEAGRPQSDAILLELLP